MRLAPRVVGKGVEDGECRGTESQREPRRRGGLLLNNCRPPLRNFSTSAAFPGLAATNKKRYGGHGLSPFDGHGEWAPLTGAGDPCADHSEPAGVRRKKRGGLFQLDLQAACQSRDEVEHGRREGAAKEPQNTVEEQKRWRPLRGWGPAKPAARPRRHPTKASRHRRTTSTRKSRPEAAPWRHRGCPTASRRTRLRFSSKPSIPSFTAPSTPGRWAVFSISSRCPKARTSRGRAPACAERRRSAWRSRQPAANRCPCLPSIARPYRR